MAGVSVAQSDIVVRLEKSEDFPAVRDLNLAAFPNEGEANLVDTLRANGKAALSLVAIHDNRVVGHILFSPVTLESNDGGHLVWGLAPMAVLPEFQRQGVGSLLVTTGLKHSKRLGVGSVIVLGHPGYYPRFGFDKASRFGVRCEYDVPDECFMLIELKDGESDRISGLARYQPEFASV